ncbi:hypothetical protein AMTRI_Chr12g272090 [Amborella trichopoda]
MKDESIHNHDSFCNEGSSLLQLLNMKYVATELATDVLINVGESKFYLHKFPLLSKSSRLHRLVTDTPDEVGPDEVHIPDIPGGPAAFEVCAKFCYGMAVTLNAYNVAAARCAAEYLEMHESVEKGNLIYKLEVFLNSSVLRGWKDSIIVLQTTRALLPWSEDLKLVARCIESIALKASVDPTRVDWSYTYNRKKLALENGVGPTTEPQWNGVRRSHSVPKDWWVEDLCELEIDHYKRVIAAVKSKGKVGAEVVGEALRAYATRRLPGRLIGQTSGDSGRLRSLVETIVWLLPSEKGSVGCGFLLKLLRAGNIVGCGEGAKRELMRRVGSQLHEACVSDLLIPSGSDGEDGGLAVYDMDLAQGLVEEFMGRQEERCDRSGPLDEMVESGVLSASSPSSYGAKVAVGKLVDGYLAEVSRDPNLSLSKFVELAEMVSDPAARPVHDGLYRAIDMYLKEHTGLSKGEKKRICGLMDCRKLSMDACMHAAQNERLPLRVVVQVLFFEQVRSATSSSTVQADMLPELPGSIRALLPAARGSHNCGSHGSSRTTNTEDEWECSGGGGPAYSGGPTAEEIRALKSELAALRVGGKSGNCNMEKESRLKGILRTRKIFSKIWGANAKGGKDGGENTSSDTSESPGSGNPGDAKSTLSRNRRHSIS